MMEDALGFVAFIFVAWGMYDLSSQRARGWLIRMVGDVMWLGLGIWLGFWSITIFMTIFAVVDLRGWLKARPDPTKVRVRKGSFFDPFGGVKSVFRGGYQPDGRTTLGTPPGEKCLYTGCDCADPLDCKWRDPKPRC